MDEYITKDDLSGYVTTDQLWSHQRQLATELQGYISRPVEVTVTMSPGCEVAIFLLCAACVAIVASYFAGRWRSWNRD